MLKQWIMLKAHSDWLLKLQISFAIHLWAIHIGFAPKILQSFAGIDEYKSSFCAILSHFFSICKTNYSPQCQWLVVDIIKWSYDLRSYERNFCNYLEKPEKFRTSTGFEPVTSQFWCDALTTWAMKPLTLGPGHLWVLMVPWGINQWWNGIWNISAVHIIHFKYHFIGGYYVTHH